MGASPPNPRSRLLHHLDDPLAPRELARVPQLVVDLPRGRQPPHRELGRHLVLRQQVREVLRPREERVLASAPDPEDLQFGIRRLRIRKQGGEARRQELGREGYAALGKKGGMRSRTSSASAQRAKEQDSHHSQR